MALQYSPEAAAYVYKEERIRIIDQSMLVAGAKDDAERQMAIATLRLFLENLRQVVHVILENLPTEDTDVSKAIRLQFEKERERYEYWIAQMPKTMSLERHQSSEKAG